MKLKQVKDIVSTLRACGVKRFRCADFEVELGEPTTAPRMTVGGPPPEPPTPNVPPAPDSTTGAGVPPSESILPKDVDIPHRLEAVRKLMKLSDEQLVDELFPLPKAQVSDAEKATAG